MATTKQAGILVLTIPARGQRDDCTTVVEASAFDMPARDAADFIYSKGPNPIGRHTVFTVNLMWNIDQRLAVGLPIEKTFLFSRDWPW